MRDRSDEAWDRITRGRPADGYLALAFMLALIAIPSLPPAFKPYEIGMGWAALGLVFVLGLRGVRSGRGPGRQAARLAFAILILLTVATVLMSVILLLGEASGGRP